jgi:hypothetical protein
MPTPKQQMEKLAATAFVRENMPPVRTPGRGDEMPIARAFDPHGVGLRYSAAPASGRLPPTKTWRLPDIQSVQ